MLRAEDLKIGRVYFGFGYEGEDESRPIISSYEYMGKEPDTTSDLGKAARYIFRFIGSGDILQLEARQIENTIFDVPSFIKELNHWARSISDS